MKIVSNKYFLINLDTEVRNNDLCKVMSEKRGWQVTKSHSLNPPLETAQKNDKPCGVSSNSILVESKVKH